MEMSLRIRWCLIFIFHIPETLGSFETSCTHNGIDYRDGEYFPPNETLFKAEPPGQCVQCRCRGGIVICEMENCTAVECDTPIQMPQSCCQQCPGAAQIYDEPSDFVFSQPKLTKKKKNDCVSGGRHYEDKSTWQPIMGPFGVMSCIECRCEAGKVICKRLRCRDLPCSNPKGQVGECCPTCPSPDSGKKGGANCLPKSSEVFVYKGSNAGNNSDRIEYAFFDFKSRKPLVELHTWDTKQRGSDILHVAFVFRKEISTHNLQLLGATSYKRYKRYLKREKRLQSKCVVRCAGRIVRMENVLKIYHINVRSKCNEDEVDTRTL